MKTDIIFKYSNLVGFLCPYWLTNFKILFSLLTTPLNYILLLLALFWYSSDSKVIVLYFSHIYYTTHLHKLARDSSFAGLNVKKKAKSKSKAFLTGCDAWICAENYIKKILAFEINVEI